MQHATHHEWKHSKRLNKLPLKVLRCHLRYMRAKNHADLEHGHQQLGWQLEINQVRQNLFAGPTACPGQRHLTIIVQMQKTVKLSELRARGKLPHKQISGTHRESCNPSRTLECTGLVHGTDARGRRKLRGLRPATGTKSVANLS